MKHIKYIWRKMMIAIYMFCLFLPSPTSNLGKRSFTTSTKLTLDTTWKWPITFQITQIQSSFKVLDLFIKFHLHLLKFKVWNPSIVIDLTIWQINVLIFTVVRIVESIHILHTNISFWRSWQERRFTMVGSLLGYGLQQPRICISHTI